MSGLCCVAPIDGRMSARPARQPFATRARELARSHTSTLGGAPWPSCCSTIRGPVSAV